MKLLIGIGLGLWGGYFLWSIYQDNLAMEQQPIISESHSQQLQMIKEVGKKVGEKAGNLLEQVVVQSSEFISDTLATTKNSYDATKLVENDKAIERQVDDLSPSQNNSRIDVQADILNDSQTNDVSDTLENIVLYKPSINDNKQAFWPPFNTDYKAKQFCEKINELDVECLTERRSDTLHYVYFKYKDNAERTLIMAQIEQGTGVTLVLDD